MVFFFKHNFLYYFCKHNFLWYFPCIYLQCITHFVHIGLEMCSKLALIFPYNYACMFSYFSPMINAEYYKIRTTENFVLKIKRILTHNTCCIAGCWKGIATRKANTNHGYWRRMLPNNYFLQSFLLTKHCTNQSRKKSK